MSKNKSPTGATTNTFTLGQDVTWTSQAMGGVKSKVGTIVKVVPSGQSPNIAGLTKKHGARSAYGGGAPRDHESYVVLVPGGKTDAAKPVLYWPVASKLQPVAPQGGR